MEVQNNGCIKCHKCRHILLEDITRVYNNSADHPCDSYDIKKFIYLVEDKLPDWIKQNVEAENWTKGKLHCSNCRSKVGSFDFVSGRKCDCGQSVLPSVHFVTSQVDRPIKL
ncbi:hypothetical protein NE865_12521 [Phthorimaea operculella]|nr:hypothetical protein NE865_12521 [Phthorimaea operculella]